MSQLGNKEIMAKNIKKQMEKNGIDRTKLSADLNISYTTLSDWINAKTYPRIDKIELMANYFGISKSDLVENIKSENKSMIVIYNQLDEHRQQKVYNYANEQLDEQNKIVPTTKYKTIKVQSKISAGNGIMDLDKNTPEEVEYNGYIPKHDLAFQVSGNSMEPVFKDSDIVFLIKDKEIRNGQIGVVLLNDEAFIKKMYVEGNKLRLVSLNKNYDDIVADNKDDIDVIGRIIF